MIIRELNETGRANFKALIAARHAGEQPVFSREAILQDEGQSEPIQDELNLSMEDFPSRFDMANHLVRLFSQCQERGVTEKDGVWDWISLAWFDQLVGSQVRDEVNYVLSEKHNRRYRHAVYFPWWLVNRYGADAKFLLIKKSVRGELSEQLLSVQHYPSCAGIVQAYKTLYFDESSQKLKRGHSSKGPGSPRRLMTWLGQIEVNYDLYAMTSESLMSLLPKEFDRFTA